MKIIVVHVVNTQLKKDLNINLSQKNRVSFFVVFLLSVLSVVSSAYASLTNHFGVLFRAAVGANIFLFLWHLFEL